MYQFLIIAYLFTFHPFDKAQTLNKHFANISRIENEPMLPDDDPNLEFSFNSINITQEEVKDQIHLLNVSKPGGPDEVMPRLIKIACNPLIEPLTQLFNRSIALGKVPTQWKLANISAIFKGKGDDQDPMNYRPISVTSCLGKILEKLSLNIYLTLLKNTT